VPELRMPRLNQITIAGTVANDLDFRENGERGCILHGRLQVRLGAHRTSSGWKKILSFFNFTMKGRTAENAFDLLEKDSPVVLIGRLRSFSRDGDHIHRDVEILVSDFQLLSRSDSDDDEDEDTYK